MKNKQIQINQNPLALAEEYRKLTAIPLLSESDAEHLAKILEIAKYDEFLDNLIEEIETDNLIGEIETDNLIGEIETDNYLESKWEIGLKRLLDFVLVNADTVNAEQIGGDITNYGQQQQKVAQAETNNSAVKTILILASNPKNTSQLRLDEEVREIDAGLQRAKKRELFDIKQRWAVCVQDVYQSLLDFKPQIIHFSGHGAGEQGLVLEDDAGNSKLVNTEALAQLFELFSSTIECVVLNACYSEVQAGAIAKHIPDVIGMNQEIGDKAAIKFATGFYSALGAGESVEFAYKLGCNVIQLDGIPEHLTPVLIKKHGVSSLMTIQIEAEIAADYMGQAEQLLVEGKTEQYDHVPAAVLSGAVLENFNKRTKMSKQAAIQIATQAIASFLPDVHNLAINAFDKVGFDMDTTGRKRHTRWIEETFRAAFWNNGYGQVNIAIWNMHLNEDHDFRNPILVTGLVPMGNGGGFRVVVFKGDGWLKNNGDRGFENWLCSGNQSQDGNVITFYPI